MVIYSLLHPTVTSEDVCLGKHNVKPLIKNVFFFLQHALQTEVYIEF